MSRGRNAETPAEMTAAGWKDVVFRIKDKIASDRVGLIAAGVAFYGLLALFPAITAMIAISGLLIEPNQVVDQLNKFSAFMPAEVTSIITDQATAVAGSREGGLGLAAIFGLLIAFYSASKGMASLIQGLNVAYDESEKRGFIKRMAVTFALTLLLIVGLIVGLAATLAVPLPRVELQAPFAPSRTSPEWKWASVGAVAGCLLWIVASAGFAFYVSNFGSYNESFGALAGVVVLLMWFWISAYVILMGAELNAELEAQTGIDTTVGPEKPMGERGAVKADNLGEAAGT